MYDVDYFIAKFSIIPANRWGIHSWFNEKEQCCALGHCGIRSSNDFTTNKEACELRKLFKLLSITPITVNDAKYKNFKTPKTRILGALRDIKQLQETSK